MNRSLFALGFLGSVAFWPSLIDSATAPKWAVLAILIPFCLCLPQLRKPSALPALAAIALAVAALSIGWTTDMPGGLDELVHLLILTLAVWLGAQGLELRPVWLGIGAGVAVSALLSVAQVLGFDALPQAVPPAGLFGNKNMLGEAGLVALIVAPHAWMAVAALVAIFLAGSKAVWGALVLVAALYCVPRRPWLAFALFGSLLAALIGLVMVAHPSAGIRAGYWIVALQDLAFFGHGLGSYAAAFPAIEFAHSEPVQLVYELGVLSLPFAVLFLVAVSEASHAATGVFLERERLLLYGIGGIGLFSFPLHMPVTAFACALAAGRILGARRVVRERELDRAMAYGV